ncbi:uncharacterized protein LOC134873730 isoform X2 [Eleginops maclovinus]|uniref:uncharacterized protein LOC134873730 isoform X2 n=1 Tax=Eleginops maclovinus TaxID=56733 RepID=UPI0030802D10
MWPCKLCDSSLSSSRAGHPEVAINSLKNKRSGQQTPAAHIKKPRKGDVNFCPNIPSGETRDGLEVERVALLTESEDINVRRDCVLSCLSIYLNEDLDTLVKEYVYIECREAEADVAGTTMAIYTVQAESDDPDGPGGRFADVGLVLEGVEVLHNLQSINHACVMLYGLIYALNLSYPKGLKNTFEV